jgi:hypothetical protein
MTLAVYPSVPGELMEELPTSNSQGLFTDVIYSTPGLLFRDGGPY